MIFPLLFAIVFSLAFPEPSERIEKISLNVIDNDKSFLSQALISDLEGEKEEVLIVFNILFANLMSALGGCWIPLELFPASMSILFGYGLKSVLLNILILFLFALVCLILAVRFFKLRKI